MNTPAKQSRGFLPLTAILAVVVIAASGLGITAYLFRYFSLADDQRVQDRVLRGVQTLSAYSTSMVENFLLNDVNRVFINISTALNQGSELEQSLLEKELWPEENAFLANTHLRYLSRIIADNREVQVLTPRLMDASISPEFAEFRPLEYGSIKNRNDYFPVILDASHDKSASLVGTDFYGDPGFQLVMDQARDTGQTTSRTSFPMGTDSRPVIIIHYFYPLYSQGARPITIRERRERLTGFLSLALINDVTMGVPFLPDSYLGLETYYFPEGDALKPDNLAPNLQSLLDSGEFQLQTYLVEERQTNLAAQASLPLRESLQTTNRWWALAIGALLTFWISTLIVWSYMQSRRVMQLVGKRTDELAERTKALSTVNAALLESESRYRMLADNVSDVIYTHDMDGICNYISPSIEVQTGYLPEEYLGKPIYQNFTEDAKAVVKRGIEEMAMRVHKKPDSLGTQIPYQFKSLCKDGSTKWLEATITTLKDRNGIVIGFLGVTRDVSARKKAEEDKENIEISYRQALKMEAIGNLAGGVAHDFNNLLTGILGHTEMLKLDRKISPDAGHSLNVIETAAVRAQELTTQLLGFARKGQYKSVKVDLNAIIRDVIALTERTMDKRIVVSLSTEDPTPTVLGDPGQMSQIFLNLAVNARDAMPVGGRLDFHTRITTLNKEFCRSHVNISPGEYCHISVTDTGQGITESNIERIFEPFFTNKDNGKGTGMGLAMVYGVVQNHGGVITVSSKPDEGTRFDIYLPYSGELDTEIPAESLPLKKGAGKVLVVDDEDIIRNLATIMLGRLGYEVITAEHGIKGISIYREQWKNIALVIVDMVMPEMDGMDCLIAMKEINPDVKAILATGYSRESISPQLYTEYAQGFLEKPFRLKDLAQAIEALL